MMRRTDEYYKELQEGRQTLQHGALPTNFKTLQDSQQPDKLRTPNHEPLTIMNREVEGSQQRSALSQVRKHQKRLSEMLAVIKEKFTEQELEWEEDFSKEL